jgi:protein SCO1/2
MQMKSSKSLIILILLILPAFGRGQSTVPPELGIVEKLGQTIPLDAELYDEKGNLTPLKSVLKKPAIITFVYYKCPGICSPLLNELARMVEKMDLKPGEDYQIITISFDHRETPEVALEKQENYLSTMQKAVPPEAWRFFTGDSATIRRLTDAAGFYFKRDGDVWIHAGALIFVSPEGKVTRYINGIQYLPFDIKMALIEASEGRTGPTIAKMLKFCYSYDPESRTYVFNFLRVGMAATLGLVGLFVLVFLVIPRRKSAERSVHGESR